jgi:septal ring factor EnvC (AmiA/AmiB activator)
MYEPIPTARGVAGALALALALGCAASARTPAKPDARLESLSKRLAEASAKRSEAEAASAIAEQRLVGLRMRQAALDAGRALDRFEFETAIVGLALAHGAGRDGHRDALALANIADGQAREVRHGERGLADTARLATQLEAQRAALASAERAFAAETTEIEALLAARRAELAARAAAKARQPKSPPTAKTKSPPKRDLVIASDRIAPTSGRLAVRFGEPRGAAGLRSRGIAWSTRPAAQIVAPADAEVSYVGALRDLGLVVILDTGDGHDIVLAGLDTAKVRAGQMMLAGEPLGAMASSGASELYMEVRRNGRVFDPLSWLKSSTRPQKGATFALR